MTDSRDPRVLVSVIVPTTGRRIRLERTLSTLLNQTLDPSRYEVIVVDDASTQNFNWLPDPVRLVQRESSGGPGGARNAGLDEAVGEFVAFTDDDCLVPRDWLASLLDAFRRYPSASAVGGPLLPDPPLLRKGPARLEQLNAIQYYRHMRVDPLRQEAFARADTSPAWGTNNLSWRAARLRTLGGFVEGTSTSEDRDLALRAGAAGNSVVFIPVVVHHNREYSWSDLWRRYRLGPTPGGHSRGIVPLVRSIIRLPRALARDLLLASTRDLGLVAAAMLRDIALSIGAAQSAMFGRKERSA